VTTQNPWLAHGLDPALKSVRCANYIRTLRRDLLKLAEATGVEHPGLIGCPSVEILTGQVQATPFEMAPTSDLAAKLAAGHEPIRAAVASRRAPRSSRCGCQ